jgi:hypothetical protein
MQATDQLLILGATMRLTRLFTSDDLGEWWLKAPLAAWVDATPSPDRFAPLGGPEHVARAEAASQERFARKQRAKRYLDGLDCPHCVGYWVGIAVLTSYLVARRSRTALALWRYAAAGLGLNTVSVLLGKQLDYWS